MKNQYKIFKSYKESMEKLEEQNTSIPVNADKLWDNISSRLGQNTKKRSLIWPVGLAAGMLATVGITLLLTQDSNPSGTSGREIVTEQNNSTPFIKIHSENSASPGQPEQTTAGNNSTSEPQQSLAHTSSSAPEKNHRSSARQIPESTIMQQVPGQTNSEAPEAAAPLTVATHPADTSAEKTDASGTDRYVSENTQQGGRAIAGRVLDSQGHPYASAEVQTMDGRTRATTDENGEFKMTIPGGASNRLEVNTFEYDPQYITLSYGQTEVEFVLNNTPEVYDEVLIETGYMRTTNKQYTGSANVLTAKDLEKLPVDNITKMLEGQSSTATESKAPQFSSNESSVDGAPPPTAYDYSHKREEQAVVSVANDGGQPGPTASIQIRGTGSLSGSTEPLYVVDGAIFQGDISTINQRDIESIKLLKDAAATSLYGSRGTNGVIIITTKNKPAKKRNIFQRIFAPRKKNTSSSLITPPEPAPRQLLSGEAYARIIENDFKLSRVDPLSTFSIDVDKASFSNTRRMINNNTVIPPDAVRAEEFINYFKYKYSQPEGRHPIHLESELAVCPWAPAHHLLRIGLQGKDIPKDLLPPANLVFLIDVSGSMYSSDKLPLVKESMLILLKELRPQDHVSIVTYASGVQLVLESTSAKDKEKISRAISRLEAGGGTSGHDGLRLAYQQAMKNFKKEGNNRIILATDGDFNIGPSSTYEMEEFIEEQRKKNIYLTCLGYGMGNYQDDMMKTLSSKGNGNYAYINDVEEAIHILSREFSSTMLVIARDVKLQVEFNPEIVKGYRLIGYERRMLNHQDFNDDKIDAGDMGAGHQVTALYEIIPAGIESEHLPDDIPLKYSARTGYDTDEIATIQFRYKGKESRKSQLLSHTVKNQARKMMSDEFTLAASLAWYAQWLRNSKYVDQDSEKQILSLLGKIKDKDYRNDVKQIREQINAISDNELKYIYTEDDIAAYSNTQE